ncbi:hypothetical protein BKA93DRAFT_824905 [Sparassis latifolia]
MALPLVWLGNYTFFPIGTTSAVCLTRDLSPEERADVLLLGCGDLRSVLYTIFCEAEKRRRLDFTCCDLDPGVLARNVLLLTMIADNTYPVTTIVWNMFYHISLDEESRTALITHCKKLINFSDNLQCWNSSPYGAFTRMCTEYTLAQLRRYWVLYVGMQNMPTERKQSLRETLLKEYQVAPAALFWMASRSAGPFRLSAFESNVKFGQYWDAGVTFSDPAQIAAATYLNPTFVYSFGGEGCIVYPFTHPTVDFHLASVVGNSYGSADVFDLVKAAQMQFYDWCSAFRASICSTRHPTPVIRILLAEATAACYAFQSFRTAKTASASVLVGPWTTQTIQLSKEDYPSRSAPIRFNVIDASDLEDNVGLLNILTAVVPLLSHPSRCSVLYTESQHYQTTGDQSLVYEDGTGKPLPHDDGARDFTQRVYADMTTIASW